MVCYCVIIIIMIILLSLLLLLFGEQICGIYSRLAKVDKILIGGVGRQASDVEIGLTQPWLVTAAAVVRHGGGSRQKVRR